MGGDDYKTECIEFGEKRHYIQFAASNAVMVVYSLACTSLVLYWTWRFYQASLSNKQAVVNRKPHLTIMTAIVSVPITAILIPVSVDFYSFECEFNVSVLRDRTTEDGREGRDGKVSQRVESAAMVFDLMLFFLWAFFIATRVWVLRFEYNYKKAQSTFQWKQLLGMTMRKPNWYASHKRTYGNEWLVLLVLGACVYLPMCAVFVFLAPTMPWINHNWEPIEVVFCVFGVVTLGFIMLNVWKFRAVHDTLAIRKEILLMAKFTICFVVVQLTLFVIGRATGKLLWNWTALMFGCTTQLLFLSVNYVQTEWVTQFAIGAEMMQGLAKSQSKSNAKLADEHLTKGLKQVVCNQNLNTVLSNKDGFELFMSFLVGEFSTENLLCFIECTQFVRKWKIEVLRTMREAIAQRDGVDLEEYCATNKVGFLRPRLARVKSSELLVPDSVLKAIDSGSAIQLVPLSPKRTLRTRRTRSTPETPSKPPSLRAIVPSVSSKHIIAHAADPSGFAFAGAEDDEKEILKDKKAVFNDEFSDDEENLTLMEWPKHYSMIERFQFLPYAPVVFEDIGIFLHYKFLEARYIRAASDLQVNVRGRLYREWAKAGSDQSLFDITLWNAEQLFQRVDNARAGEKPQYRIERTLSGTAMVATKKKQTEGVHRVLQVVEDTREELWRLMQDSFTRFRSSQPFLDYCQKLSDSEKHVPDA